MLRLVPRLPVSVRHMLAWIRGQSPFIGIALVLVVIAVLWVAGAWLLSVVYERDCKHFNTHAGAQRFYHLTTGPVFDFHGLDRDDDGEACERLP